MAEVPQPVFGPRGFIVPTEAEIYTAIFANINAAFGGTLRAGVATPQGQLATSMAAIVGSVNDTFLNYTQQSDPAFADGRMQDAIGRIYFIERIGATATVVTTTCSGLAGVVIPAGSLAISTDGVIYISNSDAVIGDGGTVSVEFSSSVLGPVPCPANSVTTIYRTIPGWDSITNAADGVIGRNTETRAEFEARRELSVAKNSVGSLPAIQGAVLEVDGVLDAYVTENFTNGTISPDGVTIVAHSVYVAVVGGNENDVAKAMWSKKAPGCNYNGNTTVTVYDQDGYTPPYPSYDVKFQIPASLPIVFTVNLANNAFIPSNATAQIQAAIIAAFAGADGGSRARIGSTIYASRYYGAVAALGSWVQIISILINSTNDAAAEVTAFIDDGTGGGSPSGVAGDKMTVTAVASGTLAVDQNVIGDGVSDGTIIVSQDSGTPGGVGVYTVTINQTTTSGTKYGVMADQVSVASRIDQVPTISAENILVKVT